MSSISLIQAHSASRENQSQPIVWLRKVGTVYLALFSCFPARHQFLSACVGMIDIRRAPPVPLPTLFACSSIRVPSRRFCLQHIHPTAAFCPTDSYLSRLRRQCSDSCTATEADRPPKRPTPDPSNRCCPLPTVYCTASDSLHLQITPTVCT